jgi:hypothetical protein
MATEAMRRLLRAEAALVNEIRELHRVVETRQRMVDAECSGLALYAEIVRAAKHNRRDAGRTPASQSASRTH